MKEEKPPGNGSTTKTLALIVSIAMAACSSIGFLYVINDNACDARLKSEATAKDVKVFETRVTAIETKQARFEGVMSERTQNIQHDVKEMKADIKTLLENLELAEK